MNKYSYIDILINHNRYRLFIVCSTTKGRTIEILNNKDNKKIIEEFVIAISRKDSISIYANGILVDMTVDELNEFMCNNHYFLNSFINKGIYDIILFSFRSTNQTINEYYTIDILKPFSQQDYDFLNIDDDNYLANAIMENGLYDTMIKEQFRTNSVHSVILMLETIKNKHHDYEDQKIIERISIDGTEVESSGCWYLLVEKCIVIYKMINFFDINNYTTCKDFVSIICDNSNTFIVGKDNIKYDRTTNSIVIYNIEEV